MTPTSSASRRYPVPDPKFVNLTITRNGENFDFSWKSREGKFYDLVSSTTLIGPICSWQVYDPDGPGGVEPYRNLPPSGSGTNTLEAVAPQGPRRFFAILEKY